MQENSQQHLAAASALEVYFISVLEHWVWHIFHRKIYPICQ